MNANTPKLTFTIYKDEHRHYRWRLRTRNRKIIADSAEGYVTKTKATDMIKLMKLELRDAAIETK